MATMDLFTQIQSLLSSAQNILLISHASIDGDGVGSGLGLQMALSKMGKKVTFYSRNPVPEVFRFLPTIQNITNEFSLNRDFIIQIDTTQTKIDKIRTEEGEQKLKIVVTPQNGTLNKDDITMLSGGKSFDLIFTLDTSNLDHTGLMNGPQAELFYETPIINIDHHITNEQYGKVNLVDVTATSTAELVLGLIEHLEQIQPLMDDDIATCLLSGVVVDTGSFQNANTTPKAFAVAAKLLAAGARQQEIVRHLFKMHELSTLKLWGRTLSKLNHDPDLKLAWTTVTKQDFQDTNAKESELDGLMDQLITSASDADIVFLMRETEEGDVKVSLRSLKNIDITPIVLPFGGGGHQRAAGFKISNSSLQTAEPLVIDSVKQFMREYQAEAQKQSQPAFSPVASTIKSAPEVSVPAAAQPVPAVSVEPQSEVSPVMPQAEMPAPETPSVSVESPVSLPTPTPGPLSASSFPPGGMSQEQTQALESSYAEKTASLPEEFLGYTPTKPAENSTFEEKTILTPQEKEVQAFTTPPQPQINLQVEK